MTKVGTSDPPLACASSLPSASASDACSVPSNPTTMRPYIYSRTFLIQGSLRFVVYTNLIRDWGQAHPGALPVPLRSFYRRAGSLHAQRASTSRDARARSPGLREARRRGEEIRRVSSAAKAREQPIREYGRSLRELTEQEAPARVRITSGGFHESIAARQASRTPKEVAT
jgi:hypothetical protein